MKRIPLSWIAVLIAMILTGCIRALTQTPTATSPPPTATNEPPTTTPTLTAAQLVYQLAEAGVTSNAEWEFYTEEFNGVAMALVPTSCFWMGGTTGWANEEPVHQVCFEEPFWIDVFEVTNAQFEAFGGMAGHASHWNDPTRPRERIAWAEAADFCALRGARLPTEAEWEYAARGPDGLVYPWGNEFVADNVVYYHNSDEHTWEVGSKPGGVSWVGIYDLIGNVYEWVNDWYDAEYYATLDNGVINPQGPDPGSSDHRVIRGASWHIYPPDTLRAARRSDFPSMLVDDHIGFRCVRDFNQ